ncbi:four helix bundle protein [Candidatus Venteria ishoeyi]|uniref:Four helix bundle protein n=1 Tax=Candidatus Venteria ishoeyi TaxID=1899563 RepID=A0A1H6F808_9GAMM|nr:four helix bundle protein [Candidatus Venteria ishoeyi]SEH05459.1 Uncharacterised protein [Candidatus Venteria ishoeyi]
MTPGELENRLIDFSITIIKICDQLPGSLGGKTLANQLVRSGTSPALNYGETQAAESDRDFVHKCGIVLKELRESKNALRIINGASLYKNQEQIKKSIKECDELISIFVASIKTVKNRMNQKK